MNHSIVFVNFQGVRDEDCGFSHTVVFLVETSHQHTLFFVAFNITMHAAITLVEAIYLSTIW